MAHDGLESHRALGLAGLTDGGVVPVRLLVRFCRLRQDPLGEVELTAERGEHPHDGRRLLLDRTVEFSCQGVHVVPLAKTFFESGELRAKFWR